MEALLLFVKMCIPSNIHIISYIIWLFYIADILSLLVLMQFVRKLFHTEPCISHRSYIFVLCLQCVQFF